MTGFEVGIGGVGLWMPGYSGVESWLAGAPDPEHAQPRGRALDRMNRRRASQLGRALSDALAESGVQAGVDASTTPIVVGSAIGEGCTMVGLLEQIFSTEEPVSPAAFSVSVHNAAAGLISISNKNEGFASALSAESDTPAASLIEGIGLVATTDAPVGVVCGDEPVPVHLLSEDQRWSLQAAAVTLVPLESNTKCLARLRVVLDGTPDLVPAELDLPGSRNPQAGMVDLVAAVARGQTGCVRLDRGAGRGYCAVVTSAPIS